MTALVCGVDIIYHPEHGRMFEARSRQGVDDAMRIRVKSFENCPST